MEWQTNLQSLIQWGTLILLIIKLISLKGQMKADESLLFKIFTQKLNQLRLVEVGGQIARLTRKLAALIKGLFTDNEINTVDLECLKEIECVIESNLRKRTK